MTTTTTESIERANGGGSDGAKRTQRSTIPLDITLEHLRSSTNDLAPQCTTVVPLSPSVRYIEPPSSSLSNLSSSPISSSSSPSRSPPSSPSSLPYLSSPPTINRATVSSSASSTSSAISIPIDPNLSSSGPVSIQRHTSPSLIHAVHRRSSSTGVIEGSSSSLRNKPQISWDDGYHYDIEHRFSDHTDFITRIVLLTSTPNVSIRPDLSYLP